MTSLFSFTALDCLLKLLSLCIDAYIKLYFSCSSGGQTPRRDLEKVLTGEEK